VSGRGSPARPSDSRGETSRAIATVDHYGNANQSTPAARVSVEFRGTLCVPLAW